MKKVKSRIVIYTNSINGKIQDINKALELTAEYLHTEVVQAQVIPRDTGTLQNEKFFVTNSNETNAKTKLAFEGPYARRLYYHPEYNFSHYANPNAKGHWLEDWQEGGEKAQDVERAFKQFYAMVSKS